MNERCEASMAMYAKSTVQGYHKQTIHPGTSYVVKPVCLGT